jgi:glycerol-3-phosphate dehydrogenase
MTATHTDHDYDLLVVGGGINGTGIANHAAQAGLRVLLVEQGDLAGATSSASSKLIHGGLRYLEQRAFRLVRESLAERERLMAMAPHLIWPLAFVLPHQSAQRPAWLIRLGLWLYDHLGSRRRLPASRVIDLARHAYGAPLQLGFSRGFVYADCWVDDARLVVANALQLRELGGTVRTRCALLEAVREGRRWRATLSSETGAPFTVAARGLVNAAGPWVEAVLRQRLGQRTRDGVRLVRGSHIVVPRLHEGSQAYLLQHTDGRIVFVLPYLERFSLIGTTDVLHTGDLSVVAASDEEVAYLCAAVARYFKHPPTPEDVVWRFAGVRPLYDDAHDNPSAITRDYVLRLDREGPPLLSVFGGKLTTYRQLALAVMRQIGPLLGARPLDPAQPRTLPGGALPEGDLDRFIAHCVSRWAGLPPTLIARWARQYGTRIDLLLCEARSTDELGQHFGGDLYEREVRYLVAEEWARSPEDVLWRRTKCGLDLDDAARAGFAQWWATAGLPSASQG